VTASAPDTSGTDEFIFKMPNAPVQARWANARRAGPTPPNPPTVACNRLLGVTSLRVRWPQQSTTREATCLRLREVSSSVEPRKAPEQNHIVSPTTQARCCEYIRGPMMEAAHPTNIGWPLGRPQAR